MWNCTIIVTTCINTNLQGVEGNDVVRLGVIVLTRVEVTVTAHDAAPVQEKIQISYMCIAGFIIFLCHYY